jgi:predicted CXXCH cytochrome family protein
MHIVIKKYEILDFGRQIFCTPKKIKKRRYYMSRHFCSLILAILVFISSSVMAKNNFVGSEKCLSCHKQIYDIWKESTHYKAVQEVFPSRNNVIADWKGEIKLKSGKIPEATIKLSRDPEGSYLATLVDLKDPSKDVTYNVVRTQGAGNMKGQMYYTKIGNNFYSLPLNWETISSRFVPSSLDSWYNEDGSLKEPSADKSWEMTCALCHQTGLEFKKAGNGYEATYSDLSIGCEKCHGPGSEHIKSPQAKGKIVNPRNLSYERGMDVCSQCHSTQGRSVPKGILRGAWDEVKNIGYRIGEGEPLANYMQSMGGPMPQASANSKELDTYHSLLKSRHYEVKTACFDCHNPHGGPTTANLKRGDMDNSLCLYCHGKNKEFVSPTSIMQHTKHGYDPDMKGTSRCTYCHMIQSRRQKTASNNGVPAGGMPGIMAGFLQVIKPQQSLEMFKSNPNSISANSCNKCHKDWSGDEAGYMKGVEAYKTKFGE